MITREMLKARQAWDLGLKIQHSKRTIKEWIKHCDGNVYVSFSGGKDSTVLDHLVETLLKEDYELRKYRNKITKVFANTGLEYPEIVDFVKEKHPTTVIIKPKMSFKEGLEKYGFPVVSKEQSNYIDEARRNESSYQLRINGVRTNGQSTNGSYTISKRHRYLLNAPFKISGKCCDVFKKNPFKNYEKDTGRKPFIGTMASESLLRNQKYLQHGCNAFTAKRQVSSPLSFWTEKDILDYIVEFNVEIASIYGLEINSEGRAVLTKERRTGCMFCMFGVHLEQAATGTNRFIRMKETHPKQWRYCIYKLGLGKVLGYMGIPCGDDTFLEFDMSKVNADEAAKEKPEKRRDKVNEKETKEKKEGPIRNGTLTISVSQINAADPKEDGCYRKWWFKSILKLPEIKKKATAFGDIVHDICERFLKADDFGRDTEGNPVELYPDGWECHVDRWGRKSAPISEEEKVAIKALITDAIRTGKLNRQKGRQVELELIHEILVHEGIKVVSKGFVDLREPGAVKDHKSASTRKYLCSPAKLKKNNQLVEYAYILWEKGEEPKEKSIMLEHLYCIKDKVSGQLSTERRFAEIIYADAKRHMNERIFPVCRQMVEYSLVYTPDQWEQIPMSDNPIGACQKYGGCAFRDICYGVCTVDQYTAKINRINKGSEVSNHKTTENTMGLKEIAAKMAGNASATAPKQTTVQSTPKQTAVQSTPKKEVAPVTATVSTENERPAAPWASDNDCPTCASSPVKGIKNEKACPVCKVRSKKEGKPHPDEFTVLVEESLILVMDKDDELVLEHCVDAPAVSHKEKGITKAEEEAKEVKQVEPEPVAEEVSEPEPEPEPEPETVTEPVTEPVTEKEVKAPASKKAEPEESDSEMCLMEKIELRGKGLLLIECAMIFGASGSRAKLGSPACVLDGYQAMEMVKAFIMNTPDFKKMQAKDPSIIGWEDVNTFVRKDMIRAMIKPLVAQFGSSTIQACNIVKGSDLDVLVGELSAYFVVIQSVSR